LPSDLTANRAELEADTFRPEMDIREFTAKHRRAHGIAAANLQPIAAEQQIAILRAVLRPCGLWEDTYAFFIRTHATVVLQTFANYETLLHQAADNLDVTATSSTAGYANVAIAAAVAAALAAVPKTTRGARSTKTLLYCWTHGLHCNHDSASCTNPLKGHQVSATQARTLDGNPHPSKDYASREWRRNALK
jgi:hypothetical protein